MIFEDAVKLANAVGIYVANDPKTGLINCRDKDGAIHSFYMTKGTCTFRRYFGDKRGESVKLSEEDQTEENIAKRFVWFCNAVANRPDQIKKLFKE